MLEPRPTPPLNVGAYEDAERQVGEVLAAARRGHEASMRLLIRMAASDALESNLKRLAAAGDRCAPTLDQLKVDSNYGADAKELRFAADAAANALSKAAGRAVIVAIPIKTGETESAA